MPDLLIVFEKPGDVAALNQLHACDAVFSAVENPQIPQIPKNQKN
jgi:hypothetical protein